MADKRGFYQLISNLTLEERQELLEKLKSHSKMSSDPLYVENGKMVSAINTDIEFSWLPWYKRLWYFLLSIFKARSPKKIYEDHEVAALGKKIERKSPGLLNYRNGMLLPGFHRQILKLKEATSFFYSALDASVNRNRDAFFAFLGSLEMPDIHQRLLEEADPAVIVDKNPDMPESEWRQKTFRVMEDTLAIITEEQRNIMYFNARSLLCLKELSSFPYDRLTKTFAYNRSVKGETCFFTSVKDLLLSLNDFLFSLKRVPHMALLESLFVFILQRSSGERRLDINRELELLLLRAEESLGVIREFNKQVPLTAIIRCASRNRSYAPGEISGGEDWFVVYRNHWDRHIKALCADYLKDHLQQKMFNNFRTFLKGRTFEALENTRSPSNPEGLPIDGTFALSFFRTFCSAVFMPDVHPVLQPVFVDGDFIKEENRIEFSWSYNYLMQLGDEIQKFEQGISPSGIHGERYAQANKDTSTSSAKQRKIQVVLQKARDEARAIMEQAVEACQNMINILNGILGKATSGKYDTLTNLAKLGASEIQVYEDLSNGVQQFQTALALLADIEVMERGR